MPVSLGLEGEDPRDGWEGMRWYCFGSGPDSSQAQKASLETWMCFLSYGGDLFIVARSYHGISDVSFFLSLETMKQYTVSWYLTFILSVTHFHIDTFSLPYLLTPTTDQKAGVLTLPSCMHH